MIKFRSSTLLYDASTIAEHIYDKNEPLHVYTVRKHQQLLTIFQEIISNKDNRKLSFVFVSLPK